MMLRILVVTTGNIGNFSECLPEVLAILIFVP